MTGLPAPYAWRMERWDRPEVLASLVKSLVAVGAPEVLEKYIEHVLASPQGYPVSDVQVPALQKVEAWISKQSRAARGPIIRWLIACQDELRARVENPPQEPGDWRRPASLSCRCELCRELAEFLNDPDERVHRFRVRKQLRHHLHSIIDSNGCDLEHQTDRRGSPQTLVCTKNSASYHKALKAHEVDTAQLKSVESMLERGEA